MTALPAATYLQDMFRFNYAEDGIEVIVERLTQGSHDELYAEVTTTTSVEPMPGLLHQAKLNLTSSRTRSEYVRLLIARAIPGYLDTVDFQGIIEQVCFLTRKRWRDGEPVIDLALVQPSGTSPYLLRPFILERSPSMLFGFGESGKSVFALAATVSVATGLDIFGERPEHQGNILYLDWEWDEENHALRLAAICQNLQIEVASLEGKIFYRRQIASLADSAAAIRKIIMDLNIILVVVDSMGGARGGEPKEAKLTLEAYSAIRTFGIATLVIDHLAKDDEDTGKHLSPIGSVYSFNSVRLMWRLDAVRSETDDNIKLSLTNTKANGKRQFDRAYTMRVESDEDDNPTEIEFTQIDPRTVIEFIRKMSHRDQIAAVLREQRHPMHEKEIFEALKARGVSRTESQVLALLNRHHIKTGRRGTAFMDATSLTGQRVWAVASPREEQQ